MDSRQLNFSHLLYLTAHHWRLAVNRRLKEPRHEPGQLGRRFRHRAPRTAAIAKRAGPELGVESATSVPLLNRLVDVGTVERIKTERDKRKRLLIATAKGLEVYQQVKTVADDLREEILTAITPRNSGKRSGSGEAAARGREK